MEHTVKMPCKDGLCKRKDLDGHGFCEECLRGNCKDCYADNCLCALDDHYE